MKDIHTPAYFRALAGDYQKRSELAATYQLPEVIVRQLSVAAINFRCAAQAIETARKRRRPTEEKAR